MPAASSEPLHKTTLNLFASDVAAMEKLYGRGWTEQVRNIIRAHIHNRKPTLRELDGYEPFPADRT